MTRRADPDSGLKPVPCWAIRVKGSDYLYTNADLTVMTFASRSSAVEHIRNEDMVKVWEPVELVVRKK